MKNYTCNIPILCTKEKILHKGDTSEFDENNSDTKILEAQKLISPVEKQVHTKTKIKK